MRTVSIAKANASPSQPLRLFLIFVMLVNFFCSLFTPGSVWAGYRVDSPASQGQAASAPSSALSNDSAASPVASEVGGSPALDTSTTDENSPNPTASPNPGQAAGLTQPLSSASAANVPGPQSQAQQQKAQKAF